VTVIMINAIADKYCIASHLGESPAIAIKTTASGGKTQDSPRAYIAEFGKHPQSFEVLRARIARASTSTRQGGEPQ
jgi:hypothetical protein